MSEGNQTIRADLGVAYGLIAGAGFGALLSALTGGISWIIVGPGVGLLLGLAVAAMAARRPSDDGNGGQ